MWLKSHGVIDQPPNHTQFRCDMNIVQRTINSYFDNHRVGFTLPFINALHQDPQSLDNISRCPMRPNESWHFWVGDLIKSAFLLGDMFLDSPWYVHNNHMKNWSFISMQLLKSYLFRWWYRCLFILQFISPAQCATSSMIISKAGYKCLNSLLLCSHCLK